MKNSHKISIIIVTIIFILVIIPILYFCNGNIGIIARDSVDKTLNGKPATEHVIKVFSASKLIYEFTGYYTVENYGGYYVVLNFLTDEEVLRLNFYGDATVTDVPIDEEPNAVTDKVTETTKQTIEE